MPTLRAQAGQVADQLADLCPWENDNLRLILIDCYSESSGRQGGRSTFPHQEMLIWDSYWSIPTLRAQADQVADQVADLCPHDNGNLRFIMIDSYSESSADQVADQVADLPPHKCWFQIHTDRLLLWELMQI